MSNEIDPTNDVAQRAFESVQPGTLYIVPTPIGNLQDITERARVVLEGVTTIAAEDSRRCRKLLQLLDLPAVRIVPLHDHNEAEVAAGIVQRLIAGETVALVSDAGTPLISDPGHVLLRTLWQTLEAATAAAHADTSTDTNSGATEATAPFRIVPLPGPSAVLTALSACPLPLHQFTFAGFLPARQIQRQNRITELLRLPGAFVVFEAPHRISDALADLAQLVGGRRLFVARELTKVHEQLLCGSAQDVRARLLADEACRGEFVVVVEGPVAEAEALGGEQAVDTEKLLFALADELPPAQAAKIAARVTGAKRADLYDRLRNR